MRCIFNSAFLIVFLLATVHKAQAQHSDTQDTVTVPIKTSLKEERQTEVTAIGLGLGQDYGGIGLSLTIYPHQNVGFFGGGGMITGKLLYNAGVKLRTFFRKDRPSASAYLLGMYGYNAVFHIKGYEALDRIFKGPTVGVGIETAVRPKGVGVWSFGLYVPMRSQEALEYEHGLKSNPFIKLESGLFPVTFSIGFKFVIR